MPWKPGQSGNPKGRPKRKYTITNTLAHLIDTAVTIDDQGETRTNADLVCEWLMRCAVEGIDKRSTDGEETIRELGYRDRIDAVKIIIGRLEPEFKLPEGATIDEATEEVMARLTDLSDADLASLQTALGRKV
jgi:hypothetical protein